MLKCELCDDEITALPPEDKHHWGWICWFWTGATGPVTRISVQCRECHKKSRQPAGQDISTMPVEWASGVNALHRYHQLLTSYAWSTDLRDELYRVMRNAQKLETGYEEWPHRIDGDEEQDEQRP